VKTSLLTKPKRWLGLEPDGGPVSDLPELAAGYDPRVPYAHLLSARPVLAGELVDVPPVPPYLVDVDLTGGGGAVVPRPRSDARPFTAATPFGDAAPAGTDAFGVPLLDPAIAQKTITALVDQNRQLQAALAQVAVTQASEPQRTERHHTDVKTIIRRMEYAGWPHWLTPMPSEEGPNVFFWGALIPRMTALAVLACGAVVLSPLVVFLYLTHSMWRAIGTATAIGAGVTWWHGHHR
jgi:hypothetical protein